MYLVSNILSISSHLRYHFQDLTSVDVVAPLNDVNDEFCSSPDPSPRKKRSSIETPMDEILQGKEDELKEAPAATRTRRASKKIDSTPRNSVTAPDFDLNKEVAPLVNMPDEKIITDEMAPIKKFQIHPKYAPWLSNSTKELMNERDLAQKKAAKSGRDDDWKDFKQMRNKGIGILKVRKFSKKFAGLWRGCT